MAQHAVLPDKWYSMHACTQYACIRSIARQVRLILFKEMVDISMYMALRQTPNSRADMGLTSPNHKSAGDQSDVDSSNAYTF